MYVCYELRTNTEDYDDDYRRVVSIRNSLTYPLPYGLFCYPLAALSFHSFIHWPGVVDTPYLQPPRLGSLRS